MQKITLAMCLCISIATVEAQKNTGKTTAGLPPVTLKNSQDSVQYALGAFVGDYLGKAGFTNINAALFLSGMNDVLVGNKRKITDSLIYPYIVAYKIYNQSAQARALETQLFNELKNKTDLGRLPSGVQYKVIKPGKGPRPSETDSVVIHFKGTLPDGSVFENTYLKNTPVLTTPATLVPGLNEALQLMPVGATWEVFIPSALGFGAKGSNNIPPNSALLVTIELMEIRGRR